MKRARVFSVLFDGLCVDLHAEDAAKFVTNAAHYDKFLAFSSAFSSTVNSPECTDLCR